VLLRWPGKLAPAIWRYASWRCIVPPDKTTADYDWRWCAGLPVWVIEDRLAAEASVSALQAALRAISEQAVTRTLLGVSASARQLIEAP
jgi:hypothetical protein